MAPKKNAGGATIAVPPKLATPGPGFVLADVPGMPEAVSDALAEKGVRTLGDLRPFVESKAATDATCEPLNAVLADLVGELSMFKRYKASEAFVGFIGGRERLLALVAGWVAPATVSAPKADDFDEGTPPPKDRPLGEPVKRYIELPPGEPVELLFQQWDRDGRIPPGCVLGQMRIEGGYTLRAITPSAVLDAQIGHVIPDAALDPFIVRVAIRARPGKSPEMTRNFAVFSPRPREAKRPR